MPADSVHIYADKRKHVTTMARGDLLVVAAYTPDELEHLNGAIAGVCPFWSVRLTPKGSGDDYDCDFGTKNVPTTHDRSLSCTVTADTIAWDDGNVWTSVPGDGDNTAVMLFADAKHHVGPHASVRVVVNLGGVLSKAVQVCVKEGELVRWTNSVLSNDWTTTPYETEFGSVQCRASSNAAPSLTYTITVFPFE